MWARVVEIPLRQPIAKDDDDKGARERLETEPEHQAAVLAWQVEGWRRLRQDHAGGLPEPPERVRQATQEYRDENDLVGGFIDECCILSASLSTPLSELMRGSKHWCEDRGVDDALHPTAKELSAKLHELGLRKGRRRGTRLWDGIGLDPVWASRRVDDEREGEGEGNDAASY